MSEKPYEFVKAEDVEPCYDCKAESGCCGKFTCSFVAKLLKERDAALEVAADRIGADFVNEYGKLTLAQREQVAADARETALTEARRLLSQQPSPRGRGV